MNRVAFFIDGFNVFHALDYRQPYSPQDFTRTKYYHKYKWLDYSALANCFVTSTDKIVAIYYFTAYAEWKQNGMARHRLLVRALKTKGVKVIRGKFKVKHKKCPLCKRTYKTYEEKRTDVNISVKLFQCAYKDKFDTGILITGDSDIIPAIVAVKESFPKKQIGVVTPIGRSAEELKKVCDFYMKMKEEHLQRSQFPDRVIIDSEKNIFLDRPPTWV